jgi:chaperonin GroES
MKIQPTADRVVVEVHSEPEVSKGGIIIPATAAEKPQIGTAVDVGPGIFENGVRVPMEVQQGDVVFFGKYSGIEIEMAESKYLIMRESDILAIQREE